MKLFELKDEEMMMMLEPTVQQVVQTAKDKIAAHLEKTSDSEEKTAQKLWINTVQNAKKQGLSQKTISDVLKHTRKNSHGHAVAAVAIASAVSLVQQGAGEGKVRNMVPDLINMINDQL